MLVSSACLKLHFCEYEHFIIIWDQFWIMYLTFLRVPTRLQILGNSVGD